MSRRRKKLGEAVGEALVVTARRAADAAAESVIEDVRGAALEAMARLRTILPPGILPPQPTQHIEYTARVIK